MLLKEKMFDFVGTDAHGIDRRPPKMKEHIDFLYRNYDTEPERVPIPQKVILTIKEAAEYSNIGINKLENLLRAPGCPFVLYVGNKKLV